MNKSISNRISSIPRWMLVIPIAVLALCSFTLLAHASSYIGIPYFGTPMQILPGEIEHKYHDRGGKGVAYYERTTHSGSPQSSSRAPKMAPGEWANYTVRIHEGTMDGQFYQHKNGYPVAFADTSASVDVFIRAATPCTKAGKYGELTFSINGDANRSISIRIDTNGEFETVNGQRVRKYYTLDTSNDSNRLGFVQTDKDNDHLFIKVKSTGNCGVYLDWFDFAGPTPSGVPVHPYNHSSRTCSRLGGFIYRGKCYLEDW